MEEHDACHVRDPSPETIFARILIAKSHRIPVYVVNALYLWPITLWTYLNYGRPKKPVKGEQVQSHCAHHAAQEKPEEGGHDHHSHGSSERPMFATVTVAVCHCGAGCVLGDIIGEWLVYGTGAKINGEALWVEYLVGKSSCPEISTTS